MRQLTSSLAGLLAAIPFTHGLPTTAAAAGPVPFEVTNIRTFMPQGPTGQWSVSWNVARRFQGEVDKTSCFYTWKGRAPQQYAPCEDPRFRAKFPVGHINVPSKDGFAIWMAQKVEDPTPETGEWSEATGIVESRDLACWSENGGEACRLVNGKTIMLNARD